MSDLISFKQWRIEEAARLGISESGVASRYYRLHKYPNLKLKRVNKRVVFVIQQNENNRATSL